jgi:ATP/maltotriose-dependent transcriptional regulator MalT
VSNDEDLALLASAAAAFKAGSWAAARQAYADALRIRESAEALLGMGMSLLWLGDAEGSVTYRERAYAEFRGRGERLQAALVALWLCVSYRAEFGNLAASGGWLAAAERLLDDASARAMDGWLDLVRAYHTTDPRQSEELATRALQFASDTNDRELELCGLSQLGAALVEQGRVDEGFRRLDEAMAGALGGEPASFDTVVFTACHMLIACQRAGDMERAVQWCRAADAFMQRFGCPYLYACCRTVYGRLLIGAGRWTEAEHELASAIRVGRTAARTFHAEAVAALAELRILQGRLTEAEELVGEFEGDPQTTVPRASLQLLQGQPAASAGILRRALSQVGEACLPAGPLLQLLVEAELARGDAKSATEYCGKLRVLAERSNRDGLRVAAEMARGLVARLEGDVATAQANFESALQGFIRLEMPLAAARAQLALASTLAETNPPLAIADARAALAAFDRLGAAVDVNRAAAVLRSLGVATRAGPRGFGALTRREAEVLELLGLGYSNPEIARRLFISRKTAEHHVASILTKLDLASRAEAAAVAARRREREPA